MDNFKDLTENIRSSEDLSKAIEMIDSAMDKINSEICESAAPKKKKVALSSGIQRRVIAATVSLFVLLFSFVFCTYAYFTDLSLSDGNHISSGYAEVKLFDITDSTAAIEGLDPLPDGSFIVFPGYTVTKRVYATNSGSSDVYVRIKLEKELTLSNANSERKSEIDLSLVTLNIDRSSWTEHDGYYYYNKPLGDGQSTTDLLSGVSFSFAMGNIYKDSTMKIKVRLEAVQAANNGSNVLEAIGWTSVGEGGASQ